MISNITQFMCIESSNQHFFNRIINVKVNKMVLLFKYVIFTIGDKIKLRPKDAKFYCVGSVHARNSFVFCA